jgi:hypothetical protein
LISNLEVRGGKPRSRISCLVERAKIGASAQDSVIGILLDHEVRQAIDDLIDDRGRGAIDKHLVRHVVPHWTGIGLQSRACVGCRDTLRRRQFSGYGLARAF